MPIQTEDDLVAFLKEKTEAQWLASGQPYLLAMVPDDLGTDIKYRDLLKGKKLKTFVKETQSTTTYKLVEHPSQRAKIGLVPWASDFNFGEAEASIEIGRAHKRLSSDQALLDFLHALSNLSDAQLEGMVIPAKVLVRLIQSR